VAWHPLQVEVVINPQIAAKAAAAVHSPAPAVGCPFRRDSQESQRYSVPINLSIDLSIYLSIHPSIYQSID